MPVKLDAGGHVEVRSLRDSREDMDLLFRWLNDEQVLASIETPGASFTSEQIEAKYGPRARGDDYVIPCILEFRQAPIGYLQYYPLLEDELSAYEANQEGLHYAIDLFIGEVGYWGRGIGTLALRAVVDYLFDVRQADSIYIDPATHNRRAIRCYEKCGFREVKVLLAREMPDGRCVDVLVMRIDGEDRKQEEAQELQV